ncbi:unnamed protein product [Symbiodinium pilosum]|uniref:Uncharacterized protein n=1 Tax=Symbiodinium pilosum TaxID=2952 RepID=A0A812QDI0_SYMPI|nr:unnamed protein product [Symbiodinium pilosum]
MALDPVDLEAGCDEALRLLQGRATRRSLAVELSDAAWTSPTAGEAKGFSSFGGRICAYALALFIVTSFAGVCLEWLTRGQLYRTLVALLLIAECLTSATYTVVVPLSYDLATHFGQGSAFSGLMVSAPFAVYLLGALRARCVMISWNQMKVCRYALVAYGIYALSTALSAAAVHPPTFLSLSATLRVGLLLALRMSYGLVDSVGDVVQMMVVKVCPQAELGEIIVSIFAANALGFGVGPLLSGAIGEMVATSDVELRAGIPLIVLACLWAVLVMAFYHAIPHELGTAHMVSGKEDIQESVEDVDAAVSESCDLATSRQVIFWTGLAYAFLCAVLTSSLEAGTALVLERHFHLTAQSIGLLLGSAFCAAAPLTVMLSWALPAERPWPAWAAVPPLIATVLLFKGPYALLGLTELRLYAVLAADVVLFSIALCANGAVDAAALQHMAGGTKLYCRENYIIAAATLRAAGSFAGPPAIRILASYGEETGAVMQLAVVVLAFACAAAIKYLGAWLHDTEADLLAAQCRLKDKVVSQRE